MTRATGRGDLGWAVFVVAVIAMMVVPVPTWVLDLLLTANLAASALVLLLAARAPSPRRLVSFPTLLLCAALLRVALGVSSTRLILLHADAGRVIDAFGRFVVSGNFVVGAVVFAVLTIVQYVVIARGAERVAEVAARFTLDALPGQQMAIDADLRAGAIRPEEARRRRADLERDAHVFGAMDGAMKFVRGDAIATILIVLVNISGGLAIGVAQRGMRLSEAVHVYSILTIGEGLVIQIPALLTSVAAGLVVTRVTGDEGAALGGDIGAEVLAAPRVIAVVAALLAALAAVPGLPAVPFLALAAAGGVAAWGLRRASRRAPSRAPVPPPSPLVLHVGAGIAATDLDGARESAERDLGVSVPPIALARNAAFDPGAWELRLGGAPIARGVVPGDRLLLRDEGALAGAVRDAIARHAHDLVGVEETRRLLDALAETHPVLVREVVPAVVALGVLAEVLRRLLAEGVSVGPLRDVVEALGEAGRGERDAAALTEHVRRALRRQITHRFAPDGQVLEAWRLDPLIEDALRGPALDPELCDDIVRAVRRSLGERPAPIVTSGDLRRQVRRLVERDLPDVAVLAYQELLPGLTVRAIGRIEIEGA